MERFNYNFNEADKKLWKKIKRNGDFQRKKKIFLNQKRKAVPKCRINNNPSGVTTKSSQIEKNNSAIEVEHPHNVLNISEILNVPNESLDLEVEPANLGSVFDRDLKLWAIKHQITHIASKDLLKLF